MAGVAFATAFDSAAAGGRLHTGPVSGFLDPEELLGDLLLPFASVAVAVILFEGGLSLRLRDIPDIGGVVPRLVTVGAAITGFLGALGAHLIIGLVEGGASPGRWAPVSSSAAAQRGHVVPLFLISSNGTMSVFATDKRPLGRPEQVVISLTMPPESPIEEPARGDRQGGPPSLLVN